MDKEKYTKRITELSIERDKVLAKLNMIEGAIMDCQYWIDKLSEEPTNG